MLLLSAVFILLPLFQTKLPSEHSDQALTLHKWRTLSPTLYLHVLQTVLLGVKLRLGSVSSQSRSKLVRGRMKKKTTPEETKQPIAFSNTFPHMTWRILQNFLFIFRASDLSPRWGVQFSCWQSPCSCFTWLRPWRSALLTSRASAKPRSTTRRSWGFYWRYFTGSLDAKRQHSTICWKRLMAVFLPLHDRFCLGVTCVCCRRSGMLKEKLFALWSRIWTGAESSGFHILSLVSNYSRSTHVRVAFRFDRASTYSYVESERLGRKSYKEQYVYIYR